MFRNDARITFILLHALVFFWLGVKNTFARVDKDLKIKLKVKF